MRRALTIAGSDSSGGAGVQQDLKVFRAFDVWGFSAVTSVTAQNTVAVQARYDLPAEIVAAQINAVMAGAGVDAVKTGMLGTAEIVEAIAVAIGRVGAPLVVDPVIVSSSGAPLLDEDALGAMRELLLPLAAVVTPNVFEASALTGVRVEDVKSQRLAARALVDAGARAAVVTGGHLQGEDVVDVVVTDGRESELRGKRVRMRGAHGTGCTFSAALTAGLALGQAIEEAARLAKRTVEKGLERAVELDEGGGALLV